MGRHARRSQAPLNLETTVMDRDILAEVHRYWFGELKSPADMP